MSEDREPPAKRPKCTSTIQPQSQGEQEIFETISITKFLDLNDDCLDAIFRYLNVIELGSVTQVCKRLQHLAALYFKRKYSKLDFSTHRLISNEEAGDVLRNFGQMIKSVAMSRQAFHSHDTFGHVENGLLKDITECCGENLQKLRLNNFSFISDSVESLNMLSNSLQHLALVAYVLDVDCIFHLSNFSSLRILEITDTQDCYALMETFPNLEVLRLDNVSISIPIMKHFIVTHIQLNKLELRNCKGISSDLIRCIGKYMKNLIKFVCDGNHIENEWTHRISNDMLHLSELKNLQSFTWNCGTLSIVNLLTKMVTNEIAMKNLIIGYNLVNDKAIEAIGKMKSLESLTFYQTKGLKDQHLIKIAEEVKELKSLRIELKSHLQENITFDVLKKVLSRANQLSLLRICLEKFHLDHIMYNDFLDIVKKRQNGIKLTFTIKNYSTDVEDLILQETIKMNKNWLMIRYVNSPK